MNAIENHKVYVIVPSFNEGMVIASTIAPLIKEGYNVVVIDDCSSDNTEESLAHFPIHYLRHELNLGQGAALQTGIDYALNEGAEYLVMFDADGQHNFQEIPNLLLPIIEGRADITMGTRFKRDEDVAQIPVSRKVILRGAILVNGLFTGMWLTDAHNGFRAMNRAAMEKIRMSENRMAHATEILSIVKRS
ncbi:MAG: glycosyltransferase family 2 protein, partial [Chitinophagales bacterium]|nr:glycosyltransferase family 2 protein [Chitinophagales bacterium]